MEKHCWHNITVESEPNPLTWNDKCCWCGKERAYPLVRLVPAAEAGHGPLLGQEFVPVFVTPPDDVGECIRSPV